MKGRRWCFMFTTLALGSRFLQHICNIQVKSANLSQDNLAACSYRYEKL